MTDKVLFPRHEGFHSHLKDDHRQGIADGSGFDEAQIMLAKNWDALGAYRKQRVHGGGRKGVPSGMAVKWFS